MAKKQTAEFIRNRKALLADQPLCHWCGKAPATEADHLIETDREGDDTLDNLVPSCKPCNSRRGATYVNRKTANRVQQRRTHIKDVGFFETQTDLTPTPSLAYLQGNEPVRSGSSPIGDAPGGLGHDLPRLETPVVGSESFGPLVSAWTAAHLGRTLFPWQERALWGSFLHDETGSFVHTTALVSVARQNGKSTMLSGIVGWALDELPRIWGRPVRIMSTAHELALATEVFEDLRETFELWEESGLAKVTWAYGRHRVERLDNGSVYVVKAATGKKHGGTYDLILADELWALSEAAIFGALRPSQIAVPSPLMLLTSTAGDESSRAFIKLREQALGIIDTGTPGDLYFAEWSMPDGDPMDERLWPWANPSLGRTITMRGLRSAAQAPDRSQFLRAHLNLWVSAAQSWMPHGLWADRVTSNTDLQAGSHEVLAVDSAVDESKYVGIYCRTNTDGMVVASVGLTADSSATLWDGIDVFLTEHPNCKLGVTPGLDIHVPEKYQRRKVLWGYAELQKFTGTVRNLILEGRLRHTGEIMLSEHVNRAVLVKTGGSVVISSQRSPGPIEAARCLIAAAALVSRPGQNKKPAIAFG